MIVGLFVSSTVCGADHHPDRPVQGVHGRGGVLLTAGLAALGTIHYDTSYWLVAIYMVVLGAGVGMLMQNLVLATQNTLASARSARARPP